MLKKSNNIINLSDLSYLKFDKKTTKYIVTLIDEKGFEIIKGYGKTLEIAINDLHHNLI